MWDINNLICQQLYIYENRARRRPDSNWCMTVLQTAPLPLGYDALKKPPALVQDMEAYERKIGFEPTTLTLATLCSTS